jgi:hypothetical protein
MCFSSTVNHICGILILLAYSSVSLIKRKSNFPHILYKEIQKGSVAKIFMTNGNGYIFQHFLIYQEALQLIPSDFPYIWGKFRFLFYQCIACFILYNYNLYNYMSLDENYRNAWEAEMLEACLGSHRSVLHSLGINRVQYECERSTGCRPPSPVPLSPWRQVEIIWTCKLPPSSPLG